MSRYVGIMYKIKNICQSQHVSKLTTALFNHISIIVFSSGDSLANLILKHFYLNKKGLRAVIPVFINYRYREEESAGHAKFAFSDYNVLTVHGITTLNTLLFNRKVRHFPSQLPLSIAATVAKDSSVHGSTLDSCENWLKFYDNHLYQNSILYKGPLLILSSKLEDNLSPAS